MAIGRTNIPIINTTTTDSGEYVRPVGAPDMDTIALNTPIIENGGINYYPIFAAPAMDTFASTTFTKTGTGISTGADAYVFSDEPSTLYVGTSVSHTFNAALDYTTDQSWKARYYIGYATEANKNAAAGITINLYNYRATYEFVGTQYLKLSSTSALFGASSGTDGNMRYINIENSTFSDNRIAAQYFCSNLISLITIKMPNSITAIANTYIFNTLPSLASLSMPNLTTIGQNYCFYNLSNVKKLDFSNLTSITGQGSFQNFNRLKTLNLPSLTTISQYTYGGVLNNCTNLNSLSVPTLTSLTSDFCSGCFALKYFKLANTISTITNTTTSLLPYTSFIELPVDFNSSGCNFTGATGFNKSLAWFHHLATQLADRSSTTAGTMVLGSANIALIPAADAATIAAKNWTYS